MQPTKSLYMEPVQGLNPYRRSVTGLEPEMPVTVDTYHKFYGGEEGVHGIVFKVIKLITKQVRRYFIVFIVL
jgi:hypothetical protein